MSDTVKTMILTFINYKVIKMKAFEYKLKECWLYEVDDLSYCIVCTCNFLVMDIKKRGVVNSPESDSQGTRTLDPSIKSAVLYQLS